MKIAKPDPAAKKSVIILPSSKEASRKPTSWNMMLLFQRNKQKRKSEITKADSEGVQYICIYFKDTFRSIYM